jgi:hypothetical protein
MCLAEKQIPCCAPVHCPDLPHGSDDPCYNKNKKYWEELIYLLSLHTPLHAMVAIVTLAKYCM